MSFSPRIWTQRHRLLALAMLVLASVGLTGCQFTAPVASTATVSQLPQTVDWRPGQVSADMAILTLRLQGGFMGVQQILTARQFVLYQDGRLITTAVPRPEIYPGPAVDRFLQRNLSGQLTQQLFAQAAQAVAQAPADLGTLPVVDAPTTVVSVVTATGPLSAKAHALSTDAEQSVLTPEQQQARHALRAVVSQVEQLTTRAGSNEQGLPPLTTYVPQGYAAFAQNYLTPQPGAPNPSWPDLSWPGPELPGPQVVVPDSSAIQGCVVVAGDQLGALNRYLNGSQPQASAMTAWRSAGKLWRILLRPLLPDEHTCADAVID